MPQIDMSTEDLHEYLGTNPRPEDVDEFWDQGIAAMQGMDPQLVVTPSNWSVPGAETFELWYTGVGGARIHAKYLRPPNAHNCPTIVMFHGYSMHSGDWSDKLAWVQQGYCVAAMDCRGQGGLSEDLGGVYGNTHRGHIIRGIDSGNPTRLLYRNIFLDAAQLVRILAEEAEVDESKIATMGGSQGGALALVAAALEPSVAYCASAYPFLSDYKRVWEMDLAKDAYAEIVDYFRRFDPTHQRHDAIFHRLGYIDIQHITHRIQAKVLMATGLQDTICPPSTQFAAFNKIPSEKEVIFWPDFGHEHLPTWHDHVMQFFNKMKVS